MEQRQRTTRGKKEVKTQKSDVKIFIQLMICAMIICGLMIFKDTALPNGKTPAEYVSHFLDTTVNIDEIVKKLNPDTDGQDSLPVAGSADE